METKKTYQPIWAFFAIVLSVYVYSKQPASTSPLPDVDRVADAALAAGADGLNWFDTKFILSLPKPKTNLAQQEDLEVRLAAYLAN